MATTPLFDSLLTELSTETVDREGCLERWMNFTDCPEEACFLRRLEGQAIQSKSVDKRLADKCRINCSIMLHYQLLE